MLNSHDYGWFDQSIHSRFPGDAVSSHFLNLGYTPIQSGDVLDFLNRRRHLLDGVVISGGEPTIQVELTEMIAGIRRLGFRIKLDTNGTRPGLPANLIGSGLVDYVAIDLKAPWSRYQEICRCAPDEVAAVQKSFELLAGNSIEWEARTTVIPQLSETDLQTMASSISPAPHFFLQQYNRPAVFLPADRFRIESEACTPARLILLKEGLRAAQPNILVR